jgi:hypothetical protein
MLPWEIRIQEPKRVGRLDHPNPLSTLILSNLIMQLSHLRPMQLRPKMVLSVVSIVKPEQIIQFAIRAYTPGDGLVRIAPIVKEITVQIGTTVSQIVKGQEEKPKFPVQ